MPRTVSQRWIFVPVCLAVVSALVALIIPAWREYSRGDVDAEPTSGLVTNERGQLRPASAPRVIPVWAVELRRWWLNHRVGPRPSGAPLPPPAWFWDWNAWKSGVTPEPPPTRTRLDRIALVLSAAAGDSWLEVRLGSESGPIRYFGTLRRGRSLRVSGPQVWIRAGIADNLVALVNGKPVRELPEGVATFLVTPEGIQTLAVR